MLFQTDKFFRREQQKIFFSRLFRKIFLEDWLMKLVALVITLGLWFGVTGLRAPITERRERIPLNLRVSNDIVVTSAPVTEVDIVITGDKRKLEQFDSHNLVVALDMTDVQAGDRVVQITPDNVLIGLPQGIRLNEVQPSKIPVTLENVEQREVNVRAETEGSVADGFEIYGQPNVVPQKVRVRGAASVIRALNFVSTEKINLENRQADFTAQQVPLNVTDPKVTALDTVVDVAFRVGEKRIERLFLVPVQTEEGVKKVKVILFGARALLNDLSSENLQIELVKNEAGALTPKPVLPAALEGKIEVREAKIQ
ncbi:MAG TPA: CdaR family protein [Pyrinomonadaceae bacterium]|jgi:hypothetical protein